MGEILRKRWVDKFNDRKEIMVSPTFPKVVKIDVCNYSYLFCPSAK
jgi:hypothetical protein